MNEELANIQTQVYRAMDDGALAAALRALRGGELVVFPTDTVYGVGADVWSPEAIARIYWAKNRPREMAIPALVGTPGDVAQVARDLPPAFAALAEHFWPGGLTIIVPRRPEVPDVLVAGGPTIAVRMPDHPVALRLIAEMGGVLAATSANLSGRPAPRTAAEALTDLEGRVAVVLDGGPCPVGVASAIVDLTVSPPRLLRGGDLPLQVLRQVLPTLIAS